jgi:arylesterase/paraoxonase
MAAILVAIVLVTLTGRGLWANGLFSSVKPGFSGVCKTVTGLPGVSDIEIAGGTAYLAVSSARGPDPRDGIYTLSLSGDAKPVKLSGAPRDFHPRGLGLYRTPNGGLFLMAVNWRAEASTGAAKQRVRFSIDSFEVTDKLVALGTIEGGLLTDPQDLAVVGPNNFYVSNDGANKNPVLGAMQRYGLTAGGNILYFNGMSFTVAADGLAGVRGLLLMPDGTHLVAANLFGRALQSFDRDMFGKLTEGPSVSLGAGPEKITLDRNGEIWAAGHANLARWRSFAADGANRTTSQIFRVSLAGGTAEQVYGDGVGDLIAGASVGASAGKRLLIGSSLDGRLLDCLQ